MAEKFVDECVETSKIKTAADKDTLRLLRLLLFKAFIAGWQASEVLENWQEQ